MEYRLLNSKSDYNVISTWWEKVNHSLFFPLEVLPINTIIISNNEEDIYAGCLYFTDSPMAWVTMFVGNPDADIKNKKNGKEFLYKTMEDIAKKNNIKVLFSSTNIHTLINSQQKSGYTVTDKGCVHLYKIL